MTSWPVKLSDSKFASVDDWYQSELGQRLLSELEAELEPVLSTSFGYYALHIGCIALAAGFREQCRVRHYFTLSHSAGKAGVQGNPHAIPIATDSVDLVVIAHGLTQAEDPHAILREAYRILIPNGKLVIIDFNPLSAWGIRRGFQLNRRNAPWQGHYYSASRLRDWMRLLGLDERQCKSLGYMLPIRKWSVAKHFGWVEALQRRWMGFSGGLNLLVYQKNITPLTPARHRWRRRKLIQGGVPNPSVGRGMKYDR